MAGEIPGDVLRFINANIESVGQLELLLLIRDGRDRDWSAVEASRALASSPESTALRLADLDDHGLVARREGPDGARYRYRPSSPAVDATIGALADAYARRRTTVIKLIFSQPNERVTSFADAFRLRRDGD